MLATAERVDAEMKLLARRLDHLGEGPSTVRVSFPTMLSGLVTDVVRGFSDERPDIILALEVSDARVDLKGNRADVVVRIEEQPSPEFVGRRVGELRVAVFAATSYLEVHPFPVGDLRHAWIAWDQAYENKAPMRFQREQFPDRRVVTEGATGEAVFQAIRAGLGLGLLPVLVGDAAGFTALYELPLEASPSVWVLSAGEPNEAEAVRAVRTRLFRLSESLRPR
jgi:DNA-binding transcriptional LysR family regulator